MQEFNCSLLREKFVINDTPGAKNDTKSIVSLSNRIAVELRTAEPVPAQETYVIRAQNMHSCVRMAAKLVNSFESNGPLLDRAAPFNWKAAWESTVSEYEHDFNPQRWVCVYHRGHVLFNSGEHHPVLDVIEKFDIITQGNYEKSVSMAEDGFRKAGKAIKLEHDGNVALVGNFAGNQGRCAIIIRGAAKSATFNFSANFGKANVDIPKCLNGAAAFLEAMQLCMFVGTNNEKIRLGLIAHHTKEDSQAKEAQKRLSRLSAEIAHLETGCDVFYRPEKPDFRELVMDAERAAKRTLEAP